jgi:hypothetical protein
MGDTRKRNWLRIQLPDSSNAQNVVDIIRAWKKQRQASMHLVNAVRLYNALLAGDFSALTDYFPGVGWGQIAGPSPQKQYSIPIQQTLSNIDRRPESDELNEALSTLGLSELDF